MKNETFFAALKKAARGQNWISSGDSDIKAVRLPYWTKPLRKGRHLGEANARQQLQNQVDMNDIDQLKTLVDLLLARPFINAIEVPTAKNGVVDLYIVTNYGWFWWVGIKVRTVQV